MRRRGETLLRSGPEFRLKRDHSVTVRGSRWYDHAAEQGGGPVSFCQKFYGLSYPEAVSLLLGGEQGVAYAPAQVREEPKQEFFLPPANPDMRRVYAYLMKCRGISREVVSAFARAGLLYEDAQYHNAVFVGLDEHGAARHAHKRGTGSKSTFRANAAGSDPRYSFHWRGSGDWLYVFEAPIDLLSFISLYPEGWEAHSYVSLCGTGAQAMLWMLDQDPKLSRVALCLDSDEAGSKAAERLAGVLRERGCGEVVRLTPSRKDWNDVLRAQREWERRQTAQRAPALTMGMG